MHHQVIIDIPCRNEIIGNSNIYCPIEFLDSKEQEAAQSAYNPQQPQQPFAPPPPGYYVNILMDVCLSDVADAAIL